MASSGSNHRVTIGEPPIAHALVADTRFSLLWLILRVYVGYQWLVAGYEKFINPAWTGAKSGTGLGGFIAGALKKTAGDHPDVAGWYASFL
jgi:thiosulfate dehydrogenase (quinone) large subunit